MKKAKVTKSEAIDANLGAFILEIGTPWEQWSIDAAKQFDKHCTIKTVLELGCGDGSAVKQFLKLGYTVTGVDINPVKTKHIKNATIISSDILDYLRTLPDNSVDNIFTHHVLEHCIDSDIIIQEIGRVLKHYCMIVVPHESDPHAEHFVVFETPEELRVPQTEQIICERRIREIPELWYIGVKHEA